MARPRSVDVIAEWSEVQIALYEVDQWPKRGWELGWSDQQMSEALAFREYVRFEAARRLRRLKRIHAARRRREQKRKATLDV